MSYETISVRMNRSDPSIPWGFTLRQQGDAIVIDGISRDSLSEKAGLRSGDRVESVCGRPTRGLSVTEAQRTIQGHQLEVQFALQRYVTSHTCLPWTLTEKDNKLIVDDMKPGFGSGFNHNYNAQSAQYQNLGTNIPMTRTGSSMNSSSSSREQQYTKSVPAQPARVFHSPSSYTSSQKNSQYMSHPVKPAGGQTYSTHQTTNYSGAAPNSGIAGGQGTNYNSRPAGFASDYGSHGGAGAGAQNYSFNNGQSSTAYGSGSGGIPLNQAAFIQTAHSPGAAQNISASSLSPRGRVAYHSPSQRSRRELSPNCSVQHLQYNSPMNLYSTETAAEQFSQQTGKPVDGRITSQSPAYLTSETKKLIEESEGRASRGLSPSHQSSSFKRISQAVGAPVY